MSLNILITGGSGFVGSKLCNELSEKGYHVAVLTRKEKSVPFKQFIWNLKNDQIDPKAVEFADVIIHLAGENISSGRWTKKQKRKISESRLQSTELLYRAVKKASKKPQLIISASAVGYYGNITSQEIFTEESPQGKDFLANTTAEWENSMSLFKAFNIRTIIFRMGVVMSPAGGALKKMLLPTKFGLTNPIGSGNQYVPWISLNDLIRLFIFSVETDKLNGVYNSVSPIQLTNRDLMKEIAYIKNMPFIPISVPSILPKLLYGKMSSIILQGSRVSSNKLRSSGFQFTDAFSDVFKKTE